MKINVDKFMTEFNDWHLPFAGAVYVVGSVLQWFHHLDASYVAFSATVLGFVGGHSYIKNRNGNDDSATPPAASDAPAAATGDAVGNGGAKG
jgi:hypothetical protein